MLDLANIFLISSSEIESLLSTRATNAIQEKTPLFVATKKRKQPNEIAKKKSSMTGGNLSDIIQNAA